MATTSYITKWLHDLWHHIPCAMTSYAMVICNGFTRISYAMDSHEFLSYWLLKFILGHFVWISKLVVERGLEKCGNHLSRGKPIQLSPESERHSNAVWGCSKRMSESGLKGAETKRRRREGRKVGLWIKVSLWNIGMWCHIWCHIKHAMMSYVMVCDVIGMLLECRQNVAHTAI